MQPTRSRHGQRHPRLCVLRCAGAALLLGLAALGASPACAQTGPWLPKEGSGTLTLGYDYQRGDTYYFGTRQQSLGGDLVYQTTTLEATYGVARRWAVDARIGHSRRTYEFTRPRIERSSSDSYATDPVLGVRYLLVDEDDHDSAPSVALRLGAVFTGSDDPDAFGSRTLGSNAYVVGASMGRYFGAAFSAQVRAVAIQRGSTYPREVTYGIELAYALTPAVLLSINADALRSEGGSDVTLAQLQQDNYAKRSVESDALGAALSVSLGKSIGLDLAYTHVTGGRNALRGDATSISLSYSF